MQREKNIRLFSDLRSVSIVKNCDLGIEDTAVGLQLRAAFSIPRSQVFTIRTSQSVNKMYLLFSLNLSF